MNETEKEMKKDKEQDKKACNQLKLFGESASQQQQQDNTESLKLVYLAKLQVAQKFGVHLI